MIIVIVKSRPCVTIIVGLVRYLGKKGIFLIFTLIFALYLTVVIANFGGKVDELLKDQARYDANRNCIQSPECAKLPPAQRNATIQGDYEAIISSRGLNEPFPTKSVRLTWDLLRFQLGRATTLTDVQGSTAVGDIILERLPRTVMLFTTASVVAALLGIWLGLRMARRALSLLDRGLTIVSITSHVIPPWVFGILFILVFAFGLNLFPSGGMVSVPARTNPFEFALDMIYHMLLPAFALIVSSFGSWAYTTRNLVLQIMDEDYVYAARARGLPEKTVLRRYVLRAASPPTVTSLALTVIASWQGAIITETVFGWPGLGRLFFDAILFLDAPVIIGLTAVYAYLLVLTVFLLDLIYGLLDPRVKALRRG
jgi:peptide/nickel transport system permease protein